MDTFALVLCFINVIYLEYCFLWLPVKFCTPIQPAPGLERSGSWGPVTLIGTDFGISRGHWSWVGLEAGASPPLWALSFLVWGGP